MTALPQAYAAFVNLGDNCEFGFAQRANGVEEGSLLRWAVTPAAVLLAGLRTRFDGLYAFDNLSPSSPDMVRDHASGLCFHTQMYSSETDRGLEFKDSESTRREIYNSEIKKIEYMKGKLLEQLDNANKVFVIKANSSIDIDLVDMIVDELAHYNKDNKLVLVAADGGDRPKIERAGANLIRATIGKFAPYDKADRIDLEAWNIIVNDVAQWPDVRAGRIIEAS